MDAITPVPKAIESGDPRAAEQLLPLVYDDLHQLAAQKLAQETPGQTLQATALVQEAYLSGPLPAPGCCRPSPMASPLERGAVFASFAETNHGRKALSSVEALTEVVS